MPRQAVTLLLRKTRDQARIEGLNPDVWDEDDYAVIDPDISKRVGRIYREIIKGESKWLWFLETEPGAAAEQRHDRLAGAGKGRVQTALCREGFQVW